MAKITKKVHAGRGQETKWEIPVDMSSQHKNRKEKHELFEKTIRQRAGVV
jgi:hypothetical protein